MARTQAADYDIRREAIIEKAAQLFARSGFLGTSVSDLAKACDTSKSLIYHYCSSKEDILYAVMRSHIDLLQQDLAEVPSGGSAEARLRDIIHRFMRHYIGAADRQKVLLNELDKLPPVRRGAIVGQQRAIVAEVTSLLSQIFPDLREDPARASATTMLLFGMINWTHTWYDPAGPISPDALADMALTLILRGNAGQAS